MDVAGGAEACPQGIYLPQPPPTSSNLHRAVPARRNGDFSDRPSLRRSRAAARQGPRRRRSRRSPLSPRDPRQGDRRPARVRARHPLRGPARETLRIRAPIPERGLAGPDPREPLYSAVAAAADWFARQLLESPEAQVARDYLTTRHLDLETVQPLGLGYAPKGKAFLDAMKGLGVRDEVLLEAALLAKREDGTLAPRFRGRLLFPIHDLRARVVAFGGRILGEGEPKYLNSSDTPIFHKGKLLYNLHVAKHAIRKAERAILVEGYFDVLRLSLAGIEEVVAPLGTGLTPEQAQLVKRHASHVMLLYDSDEPGLRATFRAGDELLREGLHVSVATLPGGEDPDTLVQKQGAGGLEGILKDAVDVLERKAGMRDAGSGMRPGTPTHPASPISHPALPASAEKALLLLMLEGEPWLSRVTEAVDPEELEFPPYRAVFESVADDAVLALDDTSARAYEQLKAEGLGARDPNEMYELAVNWMEARRLERQLEQLDDQLPFESPERQASLIAEKRRVFDELRKRYPRYKIAKRRRGAPGT